MNAVIEHKPVESFDLNGKWYTPCACGERFSGTSPSSAYGKCAKHVEKASPAVEDKTTPTPARAKVCGCGCGEPLAPRAGGLFRSGHDARFKSILTTAHAENRAVRHPLTGEPKEAIEIAAWLDERRGSGEFWRNRVLAGHKPQPERKARTVVLSDEQARIQASHARVDKIMEFQATRRPTSGDVGVVQLKSGKFGAQVLRRQDEECLQIRLLEGTARGQEIVVRDDKFVKAGKK